MNSFKLLVVFILLLFGSFAQRFQRHSINGTKNGYIYGNTEMDNLDALSSDGENAVKFVRNGEEAELELENKKLMFKFCSDGCMDKVVVACFDSTDSNSLRQGDCNPGQCEFRAGVKKVDEKNYLWFKSSEINFKITDPNGVCAIATMAFPYASSTLTDKFSSCEPLKHDGNVVKLYVIQAPLGCPLYVLNAKKFTPPPTTTTPNTSNLSETNQTTSKSSEANTTLWILIGVGIFILLIVVIGFGYCCYRTQLQKKPLFGKKKDVQQKAVIPEASKKANVVKENTADEEQVLKAEPTKDATKEEIVAKPQPSKEATVVKEKQPKPAKEKTPKETKAIVEPKPSKEVTQENVTKKDNPPPAKKVSVEPTLVAPTTEASVVQKPVVQKKQYHTGNPPRVYVPESVIHPEPKSVNAPKSGSLKTGKKDSLSGRHEIGMEFLVESTPEQVKRHDINIGLLNDETKEKLEKFYPLGPVREKRSNARTFDPVRSFDRREIEILCCARISIMFKTIEMLIDDAMKALTERGVTFDEKSNIIETPPKAEKYLRSKSTPEFVRRLSTYSVVACFDSPNPNLEAKGECGPGQCEFRAGAYKDKGKNVLYFSTKSFNTKISNPNGICAIATMAFPDASVSETLTDKFPSCEPLKHDGNVVKLYILQAKRECPLYVLNAKKWTPPPPTATQNTTEILETTSKSSEANTTLWILIGAGIFILIIVVIGFGYCCYRTQIQKKPFFGKKKDVQQKAIIPEASKKANVVKENTEDEKEVVAKPESTKVATKEEIIAKPEPPKEPTAAKEKQPRKEKISKEKKAPIVEPKPSKEITQEDNPPPAKKVSVEPTVEDPTTQASVVPKAVVQQKQYHTGNSPRVYVPTTVYHPEPKSVNAPKSGSLKTGKKDSLSGRHEIGMEGLVQSAPEQVKRHDINVNLLNDETKEKLEKFYPPGPVREKQSNARTFDLVRSFDPREIELLCCPRISIMFKIIEMLIDDAMKGLADRGVTFDEKSNIIEISPKAEKYLRSKSTPEYVRSFAFGNVFREIIDTQTRVNESFSIPLLWAIILQRRYTAVNRRKAFTWIRRELIIIEKEFSAEERSKLAYPICAIEEACKMDFNGFKNVALLDSFSGDDDDDDTQNSTTEKFRKKESA